MPRLALLLLVLLLAGPPPVGASSTHGGPVAPKVCVMTSPVVCATPRR